MIRYDTDVTINGSVDDVFPWIAEAERHEQWMDMTETRSLTPGPMQPGSHVEGVIHKGPYLELPCSATSASSSVPRRTAVGRSTRTPAQPE
jgi:hypothetical protein